MKGRKKTYTQGQLASSVFMILALLWLTISAPFVVACQQELNKQSAASNTSSPIDCNDEESGNPLGNTTEEKKPSGGNAFSEEYLHDHHSDESFLSLSAPEHQSRNAGLYTAFHGEVQVPPPNMA